MVDKAILFTPRDEQIYHLQQTVQKTSLHLCSQVNLFDSGLHHSYQQMPIYIWGQLAPNLYVQYYGGGVK